MDTRNNAEVSKRITKRLKRQTISMEEAIALAKVDTLRIFRDLERQIQKAKAIAESMSSDGSKEWTHKVSTLMDLLEKPQVAMEALIDLGMISSGRRPLEIGLEWLFGNEC